MNRHHAWTPILLLLCAVVAQLPAATLTITSTPNLGGFDAIPVIISDNITGDVAVDAEGIKTWVGQFATPNWIAEWDLMFDPDPGVSGSVDVTNNQPVTQVFTAVTGVISSVAIPVNGIMQGGATISVSDSDFSGTTAIMQARQTPAPGAPIYTAIIQGMTQRTLFPPPYALSSLPNTVNTDLQFFSNELTTTALPVGGLLELRHEFTLTSGDTATTNSTFFVVVPSPTGSALLGLGVLGLCFCRRKPTPR